MTENNYPNLLMLKLNKNFKQYLDIIIEQDYILAVPPNEVL